MAKTKYVCLDPVSFNNKLHGPGRTLELDEEDAAPLLAAGVIAPAPAEKATPPAPPAAPAPSAAPAAPAPSAAPATEKAPKDGPRK